MICLSFECEERGVFAASGEPWPDDDIAAAVGGDIAENLRAIGELLSKGVCSRNTAGAIFCRRVVRDETKRRKCSEAGKKGGGNPDLTFKGGSKGQSKGDAKGVPKASSSASSSELIPVVPFLGSGTNGGTYLTGFSEDFKRWWNTLPEGMRSGDDACWREWPDVIGKIQVKLMCDEAKAVKHLIQRTELFARSNRGKEARYRWSPLTFIQDGHYDDSVASWDIVPDSKSKAPAPAKSAAEENAEYAERTGGRRM